MYKFKFSIMADDVDIHVKNSITEEDKERFKDFKFVPVDVHRNEDMNIEITAMAIVDNLGETIEEGETNDEINE